MNYAKCDTNDTLCDDRDDTCVTMLRTLCMSVIGVYMARTTYIYKYQPSRSPEMLDDITTKHAKRRQLIQQAKGSKTLRGNKWNHWQCLQPCMSLKT